MHAQIYSFVVQLRASVPEPVLQFSVLLGDTRKVG